MTISRGQTPRQLYGLGGLLKSITKGVKSAVKGVAKTVKKNPVLGLAALNFAPMLLPGGKPFVGLGGFSLPDFLTSGGQGKSMLKVGAAGGILTGLLAEAEQGDEEAQALTRNIPALKNYLFENYKNLGYTDQQAQELTDKDTAEYTSGLGGYAEGGRIMKAIGGDTAEQNAMQASGIMGLPMNENPAGVKELDLRETGGFIPPVGVKEKADDIPAMLSNNEFVFTADAVRGMGDGNVNVGAQRMYDMMKKLENGGRV
jgi:hypothetical protein